jgi:dephospho-CoA kinase
VHPAVKKDFVHWVKTNNALPYVIMEAAILFESGSNNDCDISIVVTAPDDLRFNRVIHRDNISTEQVLARENSQMKQDEKRKLANFEIVNDENQLLIPQVLKLHEHFLTLSKK